MKYPVLSSLMKLNTMVYSGYSCSNQRSVAWRSLLPDIFNIQVNEKGHSVLWTLPSFPSFIAFEREHTRKPYLLTTYDTHQMDDIGELMI